MNPAIRKAMKAEIMIATTNSHSQRKRSYTAGLVLLFAALLGTAWPAPAMIDVYQIGGEPLTLSGSLRGRWEVWNWFGPGKVANHQDDNRYHFQALDFRLGVGYQLGGVKMFVEMMSPVLLHLPDDAQASAPQGALGLGPTYFQSHRNVNDANVFVKQGFVEFGERLVHGLSIKGGRFEFADGAEIIPEDPELKWLTLNRIQQRLIGPFGFTHVMRSFDGAVTSYGGEAWKATAMYAVPTKGAFDLNGMDELRSTDVIYASLSVGPNPFWGNAMGRLFYIYYDDGRRQVPTDNRPLKIRKSDLRRIEIHTLGADYLRTIEIGPGTADILLWGGGELGSWGRLTQEAWAATAEAGYRLTKTPWQPWLRIGYTTTSGDSNSKDSTHETFFQILPTARVYAQFPFYNMMNLDDASGELVLFPAKGVDLRTTIHGLWLSSNQVLWYAGGGAYQRNVFGFVGRPSSGRSYLATLLDFGLTWKINTHVSTYFYYGHAFGGSVISAIYHGGKEADFGYVETTLSF